MHYVHMLKTNNRVHIIETYLCINLVWLESILEMLVIDLSFYQLYYIKLEQVRTYMCVCVWVNGFPPVQLPGSRYSAHSNRLIYI